MSAEAGGGGEGGDAAAAPGDASRAASGVPASAVAPPTPTSAASGTVATGGKSGVSAGSSSPSSGEEAKGEEADKGKDAGAGSGKATGSGGGGEAVDVRVPGAGDFLYGVELGEGAYARVMHCRHKESGRDYAVKVMEKRFIRKEGKVAFVMNEKHILSTSDHQNLVKLLFTFHDKQYLYMVMELCRAGELLGVIRKKHQQNRAAGTALSLHLTRWYLAQVLAALEYLHFERHIVHRDLKPENILIDDAGHIKLTDFGTARDLKKPQKAIDTEFVGTAEYVSPEVLHDDPADRQADLWAFGCVAYQCLVGKPPFRGDSEYLTFQQIMNYPDAHGLDFPETFPDVAIDFVTKLLQREPKDRLGGGDSGSPNDMDALKAHPFWGEGPTAITELLKSPPPYIPAMDALPEPTATSIDDMEEIAPFVLKHARRASVRDIMDQGAIAAAAEAAGAGADSTSGTEYWRSELALGETVVKFAIVDKRKGLFSKTRELILTDKPRVFYLDPDTEEYKGEVPWSKTIRVAVKNDATFDVVTPKRTYHFTDNTTPGAAAAWKLAFDEQIAEHAGDE